MFEKLFPPDRIYNPNRFSALRESVRIGSCQRRDQFIDRERGDIIPKLPEDSSRDPGPICRVYNFLRDVATQRHIEENLWSSRHIFYPAGTGHALNREPYDNSQPRSRLSFADVFTGLALDH
jgi:hypothetical protein